MRLTLTSNDIKYYNTDEVKVSIDRANGIVNVSPVNGTWTDAYTKTVKNISFAKAEDSGSEGDIDNPEGKVKILESKGWHESAFVKWEPFADASSYIVYVKVDNTKNIQNWTTSWYATMEHTDGQMQQA